MNAKRLVACILLAAILQGGIYCDTVKRKFSEPRRADFYYYYVGARMLADGANPYSLETVIAYNQSHPQMGTGPLKIWPTCAPCVLAGLVPLARAMSLQGATRAWLLLEHVLLVLATMVLVACFRHVYGVPPRGVGPVATLFSASLFFAPLITDLHQGQLDILLLLVMAGMLWFYLHQQDTACGCCLAIAVALKPQLALLTLYFLYRRRFTVLASTLACYLGFNLLAALCFGFDPVLHYPKGLWLASLWVSASTIVQNQSLYHMLRQLLPDWCAHWVFLLLAIGLSWITVNAFRDDRPLADFALLVTLQCLVASNSWTHHHVVLLLPLDLAFLYICYVEQPSPGCTALLAFLYLGLAVTDGYPASPLRYDALAGMVPVFLLIALWLAFIYVCREGVLLRGSESMVDTPYGILDGHSPSALP